MKTLKTAHQGILAGAIALAGLIAAAPAARADDDSRNVLNPGSYERMSQLSHQLDSLAQRTSQQAQVQQGGYRGVRRDTKFLKSIDHFADRVRRFHQRLETYRTQQWNVDEEIEHLMRDARNVQKRLQRARFVDQQTHQDWNQVVSLLNQMGAEYRTGTGYASNSPYGAQNPGQAYPGGTGHPTTGYDPHGSIGSNDPHGYGNATDLRQLAYELDQRAARASELAGRSGYGRYEYASNIQHFSEQARTFRGQVDQNRLTRSDLRNQVNHLLEDAQKAQEELRRTNASRDLAAEWEAVVRILTRMRDLASV